LKWFDVDGQALKGAGHLYISKEKKVEDLVTPILKRMGWAEKAPGGERVQLKLWEEIKPSMIEPMKAKQSLKAAELQDGDIVCFQKTIEGKSSEPKTSEAERERMSKNHTDRIEDGRDFYDFLLHKRVVRFYPHPTRTDPEKYPPLDVTLSSKQSYDQVAAKVGEKLGVDPTHLRFHTVNATSGVAKAPVKRNQSQTLQQILNPPYSAFGNSNPRPDALFFEVLDMSLSELDTKKALKVTWLSEGITKDETFDILVPKTGNVDDLIAGLIKKAQLSDEGEGPIRLYETHSNKVYKELGRDYSVVAIMDYVNLVAERVPEEERTADPSHFIQAFHFQGEPSKSHGIPFRFLIKPDEKFLDTKKRLEKRTGMKGKNFEKIKFAVVKRSSYSKPTYLSDNDVLWDVASQDDDLLGLDHVDRTRAVRNGAGDLFLK